MCTAARGFEDFKNWRCDVHLCSRWRYFAWHSWPSLAEREGIGPARPKIWRAVLRRGKIDVVPARERRQQLLRSPRRVPSPSLDQQLLDGIVDTMRARPRGTRAILQSFDAVFSEATYTAVTCFATDPEQLAQLRKRVL